VKGEVKVEKPETKDSVKTLLPPTAPVTGDTLVQKEIIMGKPSFHPVVIDGPQKIDPVIVPVKVETQEVRIDTMQVEQPVTVTQAGNTIRIAPLVPEKEPVSLEVMPNPSRGLLNLKYVIREKGATTIELYNLNGTRVKTFVSSQLIYEGTYKTTFDISDLPDGIYICTLRSGEQTASNKVILTK
jgi:hypothetical protein